MTIKSKSKSLDNLGGNLRRAAKLTDDETARTKRDDGSLVIRGVLATSTPVVHFVRGIGRAKIQLDIPSDLISRWQTRGINSLPLMRDHGIGEGLFSMPGLKDRLGRIQSLSIEGDSVVGDWVFDPDLARDLIGPLERGNLRETSAQFRIDSLSLLKENDGEPPLYLAQWTPIEGSLVWASADVRAQLRNRSMNLEQIIANIVKRHLETGSDPAELGPKISSDIVIALHDADSGEEISEQKISDAVSKVLREQMLSRVSAPVAVQAQASTKTQTSGQTQVLAPAPVPESLGGRIFDTVAERCNKETALRLWLECKGDVEAYGKRALEEFAKEPAPVVSTQTNAAMSVQMGLPAGTRALRDLVTITVARGLQGEEGEAYRKAASLIDPNWREMPPMAFVQGYARAAGSFDNAQWWAPLQFVKAQFEHSRLAALQRATIIDGGARYYRDSGGLVPADLPAAFRDINRITLLAGYMRHALPFERIARALTVVDFRQVSLVHVDLAGRFEPLAVEQQLLELVARDQEGFFRAKAYGHFHRVSYVAIVNDQLQTLVQIPQMIGDFYAGGENKVFATVLSEGLVGGVTSYTGDFLITVNPIDFKRDFHLAESRALETLPIPPKPGQDPTYTLHFTEALVPTVAVMGKLTFIDWHEYMDERDGRTFDTPANTIRRPYLKTLWRNSHRSLYFDDKETVLYPGPESTFCPISVGRVSGQGLRIETSDTGPMDQDGLIITVQNTLGCEFTHNRYAYKIKDTSP